MTKQIPRSRPQAEVGQLRESRVIATPLSQESYRDPPLAGGNFEGTELDRREPSEETGVEAAKGGGGGGWKFRDKKHSRKFLRGDHCGTEIKGVIRPANQGIVRLFLHFRYKSRRVLSSCWPQSRGYDDVLEILAVCSSLSHRRYWGSHRTPQVADPWADWCLIIGDDVNASGDKIQTSPFIFLAQVGTARSPNPHDAIAGIRSIDRLPWIPFFLGPSRKRRAREPSGSRRKKRLARRMK